MNNEPVAWRSKDNDGYWSIYQSPVEGAEPLYTHPAKNNGGNPEELNTRQIQDARTSLESTPPFAYAVVSKECPDGMENMSLQFNEPVDAKKVIPLYERPIDVTDEEDTECQYCKQGCIRCDARKLLTDEEIIEIWSGMETDTGEQNIIFARAILRKAQEGCTK